MESFKIDNFQLCDFFRKFELQRVLKPWTYKQEK